MPKRITPKPVPRNDGSIPKMTRLEARSAVRRFGSKTGEAARGEAPPMRFCICSNCCRVMPTGGFCQRRRSCKRKNAVPQGQGKAFLNRTARNSMPSFVLILILFAGCLRRLGLIRTCVVVVRCVPRRVVIILRMGCRHNRGRIMIHSG